MADDAIDSSGGHGSSDWHHLLERLLDLATDRHIEDDPYSMVCVDMLQAYRENLGTASQWGHATGDPASLRAYLLEEQYAVEYAGNDTVVLDMPDGRQLTYYVHGGAAWRGIRAKFDGVKAVFGDAMSHSPDSLAVNAESMRQVAAVLKPVDNPSGQLDKLTETNLAGIQGTESALRGLENFNARWGAFSSIDGGLAPWDGVAAEIFRGAYIDTIPSILTGQTIVATALADSLTITSNAYRGLRDESLHALRSAVDIMALYPARLMTSEPFDWSATLDIVAGVAGTVSGVTGFEPGPGTVVSVVAALIAGTASLAKTIIGSPELTEAKARPVNIGGDSALEIMMNFEVLLRTYQNTVTGTEEVLKRTLAGLQAVVDDRAAPGIVIRLTWGGVYPVSQRNTYFETMRPALGDLDSDTKYSTISSNDYMGVPPDSGAPFAADLQRLLLMGHEWLPQLSANYHGLSGSGAASGVDAAFTRSVHGYSVGDGESHAGVSKGVLYPQWIALYDDLMGMLKTSGDNLDAAATGLIAVAIAYAEQDDAAAGVLKNDSQYY